jgi:hypothetical protein
MDRRDFGGDAGFQPFIGTLSPGFRANPIPAFALALINRVL